MRIFTLLFLFTVSSFFAQVETSSNLFLSSSYPAFYIDAANYKSVKPDKTRLDVFVQVPYSNIQFIRNPKGFRAKYSVHLTFFSEDTEMIVVEKIWNETVEASSFDEAGSQFNSNYSYRTFELRPGPYKMMCKVTDKDSKKDFEVNAKVNVEEFSDSVGVSDLIFMAGKVKNEKGEMIVPNIAGQILDTDSTIAYFFDIYSNSDQTLKINYTIEDKEKDEVLSKDQMVDLKKGTNSILASVANKNLTLGRFNLKVALFNPEGEELSTANKYFRSTILGFPKSISDIDQAIEQMEYIASQNDIDYISAGETSEERLQRFKLFWKKKDPTKNTIENEHFIEYYRRIAYANANFESYYKGWRTDMGMVYVMLGTPNNVERHPFEINSKPYQVWDYYDLNRRFVFVDQTGFGDYRLLNQDYGDWYRYRY